MFGLRNVNYLFEKCFYSVCYKTEVGLFLGLAMKTNFVAMLLGVAAVSASASVMGQTDKTELGSFSVTAESIEMLTPTSLRAKGNVVISGKNSNLHVDEALITEKNGVITIEAEQVAQDLNVQPKDQKTFSAEDLKGARAAGGEMKLMNSGFVPVKTRGLTTVWKNEELNMCLSVTTANGRYSEVITLSPQSC